MVQKVNDVPGAYEALTAEARSRARRTGVPDEIMIGFFNRMGHFPMSIAELNAWGTDASNNPYGIQRRTPDGVWHPITPGMLTPGKTDQDRGGFRQGDQTGHQILNAEDSDIQRFQDFHPEILDAPMAPAVPNATGPRTGATASNGQGAVARSAAVAMDQNNYVSAAPNGQWVAVVGGTPVYFNSQQEAEQNFNQRTGGTAPAPSPGSAPPAAGPVGAPGPGSAGPGASPPASGGGSPGVGFNPDTARAVDAAMVTWLANRRFLELEMPDFQLKTEVEKARMRRDDMLAEWKRLYDEATLTGTINGKPTQDATKQQADITGYQPGPGTGKGQAVMDAMAAVRANPQYQALLRAGSAGDQNAVAQMHQMEAAAIQQAAPGLDAATAAAAIDRLRSLTAQTRAMSTPALVEQAINDVAPKAPTLGRERDIGRLELDRIIEENRKAEEARKFGLDTQKEQDTTLVSVLNLLSNLRGPENAFAYANTLANVPESVRQNIATAMARLPVAPRNPAAAGVWNDVQAQTQQGLPPSVSPGASQVPPGVVARDPGFTAVDGPTVRGQPGAPAPTGPALPEPSVPMPGGMTAIGQPVLTQNPGLGGSGSPLPPGAQLQNEMNRFPAGTGPTYGPRTTPGLDATAGGTPPGFFPSMTNTTPLAPTPAPTATGQPVMVSGAPLMSQDPRAPAPAPAVAAGMQSPSQWSPTEYNRTDPYARKLQLAGYENAGEDPESVQWRYQQSLPKAYGPRTSRLRAA